MSLRRIASVVEQASRRWRRNIPFVISADLCEASCPGPRSIQARGAFNALQAGQDSRKHYFGTTGAAVSEAPYTWIFLDAAGTLIEPTEAVSAVYCRFAQKHGLIRSEDAVLERYRSAYQRWQQEWPDRIRFRGDARDFWVCPECFEDIYAYFATKDAWRLRPDARSSLYRLKESGFKLCCVSNFDTRLPDILYDLGIGVYFDAFVVSGEVGYEKPSRGIFDAALEKCGARPEEVVHIGDDRRNDIWGAREAGIRAWQFGNEVKSFTELVELLVSRREP